MKECSGVERGKVSLKGSFTTVDMVAAFIVKIKNPEICCSKPGWQKLAAFRGAQNNPSELS